MEEQINKKICNVCNKEKKIYCKQTCKSCYNKSHQDKEKQKACQRRWREKNPDYFKNYSHKHKEVKNETRTTNTESTI